VGDEEHKRRRHDHRRRAANGRTPVVRTRWQSRNNDGQIRLQLLIDYGGTLYDPEDDVVLDEQLIFGSTGTNDSEGRDFCEDFLAITG
jgi:hypothetical protein